jgi:hypothetical protein
MPNPNWTEIITTTLESRNKEFADNVTNNNALLARLNQKGNVRTVSGGNVIAEELEYAENSTFQFYTGYEVLDISPSDVFTAAEFPWKQGSVNVSASGLEVEVQNTGPEAVIPLLEKRIENAKRTAANKMSESVYSDGTGTSGKELTGLQAIVADDPTTGTVGGIDRSDSTNVFWRNQTSGDVANIDTTAATLRTEMQAMWLETKRGRDVVDLIATDQTLYSVFWDSLTDIQRIASEREATAGFETLKYVTADVIYDGDSGIAANHMYFLNTDYLYLRPHARRNWVPMDKKSSVNQDAMIVPLVWAGNLTCSNAARQGIVYT